MLTCPDLSARETSRGRAPAIGVIGTLLVLLAGAAPALAQEGLAPEEQYTLRLEYLWWSPTPQGELQKGLGDFEGTVLDIESDLGVESGNAHNLRGAIRLGPTPDEDRGHGL